MPQILTPAFFKRPAFWAMMTVLVLVAFYFWQTRKLPDRGDDPSVDVGVSAEPLPGAPVPGGPVTSVEALNQIAAKRPEARGEPQAALPRDSEAQFQSAYRQCVPEAEKKYANLRLLLEDLEDSSALPVEKQWENYQIRLPDGDIRRIMLIPRENVDTTSPGASQSPDAWELRYFGVDAEDLPVTLPLPDNIRGPQDLPQLLSMGQASGHQVAERLSLPGEEDVMIERRDGEIVDFQWRRPRGSLVCSVDVCRCLQGDED